MAFDGMSVVIDADIRGFDREIKRAEKIAERFRNQLAGRLLGGGTAIAGGAAFVRGISQRMEELAGGEKSPLDRWFGPNATRDARAGLEDLEKRSLTIKGIWTGIKDLFAVGAGELTNAVRFFGINTSSAESIKAGERRRKFDSGAEAIDSDRTFKERYRNLDSIQKITEALQSDIDKMTMSEEDITREKIKQLALGHEGTEIDDAKIAALDKILELEQKRVTVAERKKYDDIVAKQQEKDAALTAQIIEEERDLRQRDIDRYNANFSEERQRMIDRAGGEDFENPIARYEAMIADLEQQLAGQAGAGLAGLAVRGSQDEARIVNAQRNRDDARNRDQLNTLRDQLQTQRQLLQVMRAALAGAFTLN